MVQRRLHKQAFAFFVTHLPMLSNKFLSIYSCIMLTCKKSNFRKFLCQNECTAAMVAVSAEDMVAEASATSCQKCQLLQLQQSHLFLLQHHDISMKSDGDIHCLGIIGSSIKVTILKIIYLPFNKIQSKIYYKFGHTRPEKGKVKMLFSR